MTSTNPLLGDFETLVDEQLAKWHVPGIAISVVNGNETWSQGYGKSQLHPVKEAEPTTLFYVGSLTKAMLCAAWAIYISSPENEARGAHRITFSTPLADLIRDDFVLADPVRTLQVTIEDAVSHRSGMARHDLSYGHAATNTPREVTRNLRHLPFHHELRTHFEYCNVVYTAASYALEVVAGKPMGEILREWIWEPLGMKQTYAGLREAEAAAKERGEDLSTQHVWSKRTCDDDYHQGEMHESPHIDLHQVSGAGYMISSAADYGRWIRCLLTQSHPLSPSIVTTLFTPRTICPPPCPDDMPDGGGDILLCALGWFVGMYRGHRVLCHAGGITGGGSYVLLVPSLKFGAAFLSNGHGAGHLLRGLVYELLERALSIPPAARTGLAACEAKGGAVDGDIRADEQRAWERLCPPGSVVPWECTVPPGRPWQEYAGTYRNPAYGSLTFRVPDANDAAGDDDAVVTLHCKIDDRVWHNSWTLRYVNAEHWLITARRQPLGPEVRHAHSKIGSDGKVKGFSIAMEPSMPDALFWFERQQ